MRGALFEFRLPQPQQSIDIALGALRPIHHLRPVTALMPTRNDELEEIDDVVGMKVGEKDRVHLGAVAAGGIEALGGARTAIDEIGRALMSDDL